jgi:hypothetical protein
MMLRIKTLDGSDIASAYSGNFDAFGSGRWGWIQERVAERFSCDVDDVSSVDTDDELDLIIVKGVPMARMVRL